jgi:hypothetical protein
MELVVADGKGVIDQQPTVAGTIVVLGAPTLVGVVGVRVAAALERTEVVGRMGHTGFVPVGQSGLLAVGTWQPSEEMVERPVLHADHDDVVDP